MKKDIQKKKKPHRGGIAKNKIGLTAMQELFVREYLIDLNGTAAAKRAGYSEATAMEQSYQLLQKPSVRSAIENKLKQRFDTLDITGERILREIAAIAFSNINKVATWNGKDFELIPSSELSDEDAAILKGISVSESSSSSSEGHSDSKSISFSTFDKLKALELLAKNKALLTDKVEHSGNITLENILDGVNDPKEE